MSADKFDQHHDYSMFDKMSTEELEEILRMDSYGAETDKYDTDAILYIMEVVANRQNSSAEEKSAQVEQALAEFKEWYLPSVREGSTLYQSDENRAHLAELPIRQTRKSLRSIVRRVGLVAAVIIVIFAIMITAQATGIDIFGAIARWTDEIFYFTTANEQQNQEWFSDYQDAFEEAGPFSQYIPTWIPEEFVPGEPYISQMRTHTELYLPFEKSGGQYIDVSIAIFDSVTSIDTYFFQKDSGKVNQYEVNGKTIYLFSNYDILNGICLDGNAMIDIGGTLSLNDIQAIFDSIEGLA